MGTPLNFYNLSDEEQARLLVYETIRQSEEILLRTST